jgi:hypothetical protein
MRLGGLRLHKFPRDSVQLAVHRTTFLPFSLRWHHYVGDLQRWRLTRQREQFVHSDPGADCGIAQGRLPIFSGIRSAPTVAASARMGYQVFFSLCYRLASSAQGKETRRAAHPTPHPRPTQLRRVASTTGGCRFERRSYRRVFSSSDRPSQTDRSIRSSPNRDVPLFEWKFHSENL